jgi:hypothetical protein
VSYITEIGDPADSPDNPRGGDLDILDEGAQILHDFNMQCSRSVHAESHKLWLA